MDWKKVTITLTPGFNDETLADINKKLEKIGLSLKRGGPSLTISACPFCGSEYLSVFYDKEMDEDAPYRVECASCHAIGPNDRSPRFAVEGWNLGKIDRTEEEREEHRGDQDRANFLKNFYRNLSELDNLD